MFLRGGNYHKGPHENFTVRGFNVNDFSSIDIFAAKFIRAARITVSMMVFLPCFINHFSRVLTHSAHMKEKSLVLLYANKYIRFLKQNQANFSCIDIFHYPLRFHYQALVESGMSWLSIKQLFSLLFFIICCNVNPLKFKGVHLIIVYIWLDPSSLASCPS